jgi:hypothetical protein
MSTKTAVKVLFAKVKETKNTHKFEELPEPGTAPAVGTLYVQKHILHELGNPDSLTVTIES